MRSRRSLLTLLVITTLVGAFPVAATAVATPHRATAQSAKLKVVEQGFSSLFDGANVVWVAIIKNTSKDVVARYVTVTATITDAAGTVVYQGDAAIDTILPGTTSAAATGGPTTGPGAAKLRIEPRAEFNVAFKGKPGSIKATDVKVETVENGELTRTTGTLVSNLRVPVEEPETVVVYRDADGKPIGGTQEYQDVTVPKKGRAPFETSTYTPLPPFEKVDVYVIIPSTVNRPVR